MADVSKSSIGNVTAVTASVAAAKWAFAGGGIDLDNTIDNTVDARIEGPMSVLAEGDVSVLASEDACLEGDATAVAIAAGIGAAIGVSLIENDITSTIQAEVADAAVTSQNTRIRADSIADVAKTISAGISASAVGVQGNRADANIGTLVKAFTHDAILISSGDVTVEATADNTAKADTRGGAFGAVAVGSMIADVHLGDVYDYDYGYITQIQPVQLVELSQGDRVKLNNGDIVKYIGADPSDPVDLSQQDYENNLLWKPVFEMVEAALGDGTSVQARALRVSAVSTDDLLSESVAGGGGAVAAAGAESMVTSDYATLARIGAGAQIEVDALVVNSNHVQDIDAKADSYALALAAGSGAGAHNTITSKANVDIGAGADVAAKNIVISAKNQLTKDDYKDSTNLRSGSASGGNITVLLSETEIGTGSLPLPGRCQYRHRSRTHRGG